MRKHKHVFVELMVAQCLDALLRQALQRTMGELQNLLEDVNTQINPSEFRYSFFHNNKSKVNTVFITIINQEIDQIRLYVY